MTSTGVVYKVDRLVFAEPARLRLAQARVGRSAHKFPESSRERRRGASRFMSPAPGALRPSPTSAVTVGGVGRPERLDAQ